MCVCVHVNYMIHTTNYEVKTMTGLLNILTTLPAQSLRTRNGSLRRARAWGPGGAGAGWLHGWSQCLCHPHLCAHHLHHPSPPPLLDSRAKLPVNENEKLDDLSE